MSQLEEQHPDIYQQFQECLHVVRRSDLLWAGLSTDLVIEQVLMRSMKTSGGLTSHILFLHAILGCDTTSQPHGIGKGNSLKKFRDCDHLRDLAEAFNSPSATAEEISTAGEQVLVTIHIMVSLGRHLILYDTNVFVRKWPESHLTFNPRLYHQHQLQPSFTAFAYTSKYNSGKEQGMVFCQKNGGGEKVKMKYLSQLLLIYCLLQMISCILFDVTASQIVVL